MKKESMKMDSFFLVFLLIFINPSIVVRAQNSLKPPPVQNLNPANLKPINYDELAAHPQWLRIMHYRGHGTNLESEIDGLAFFNSKNGKTNSVAELKETLGKILNENSTDSEENRISCRFPLRKKWLIAQLPHLKNLGGFRAGLCPRYEKWARTVQGPSVSIVFSSYYINNPASMFGHTFLRINKEAESSAQERHALLDYGVNYAANPNTDNPLMYSLLGLFGGFPGTFSIMPYYYKVREYNNAEARDLWEYQLNLSPDSVENLVQHLWELGPTFADYWYLTENCSYHVLTLLEAADEKLQLVNQTKKFIIPVDTLKIVTETPGLLKSTQFRPSIRSEFKERRALLSPALNEELVKIVNRKKNDQIIFADKLSENDRKLILDAALDWADFDNAVAVQKPETTEFKFKSKLLSLRSQITLPSEKMNWSAPDRERPDRARGSARWKFGLESYQQNNSLLLGYRFALQDLLDPVDGYPDGAQIQFFDIQASYAEQEKKLNIDKLILFEVVTLTPRDRLMPRYSWRLKVGFDQDLSESFFLQRGFEISGGLGWTLQFFKDQWFYAGLYLQGRRHANDKNYLTGGPQVTFRKLIGDKFSYLAEGRFLKNTIGEDIYSPDFKMGFQYHLQANQGLRINLNGIKNQSRMNVEWLWSY